MRYEVYKELQRTLLILVENERMTWQEYRKLTIDLEDFYMNLNQNLTEMPV